MSFKTNSLGYIVLSRDAAKAIYKHLRLKVYESLNEYLLKEKIEFAVDCELINPSWKGVSDFAQSQTPMESARAVYFGSVTDYFDWVTLDEENNLRNLDFNQEVSETDLIDAVITKTSVSLVAESEDVTLLSVKLRLDYSIDDFNTLYDNKAEFETRLLIDDLVRDEALPKIETEQDLVNWITRDFMADFYLV